MHPHSRALHSPAYDASEEDNDPLTDDAASLTDVHVHSARPPRPSQSAQSRSRQRHALAALVDDSDAGTDSPTYDGDIESSTTAGPDNDRSRSADYPPSAASTLASPASPATLLHDPTPPLSLLSAPAFLPDEPAPAPASIDAFDPAKLSPADIQQFVRAAIAREDPAGRARPYTIKPPPPDRPVRIYADGVYDLFHFGHALQLRQAKLSFPFPPSSAPPSTSIETVTSLGESGVYLLVGVNSDEQCIEHKNLAVMTHAERCEAVRHCRWVDEVVADAPWVIDESFLQKYKIDYVAHDEDPYAGVGTDDVYGSVKRQGKFIPTRRTPGVSTSDLLERIVQRYRARGFDAKLARMGHAELMAAGSDYDGSAPASVRGSRAPSVMR